MHFLRHVRRKNVNFPSFSFFGKMDFRVELDVFRGPLDLLLFLVRKHELDIRDLPIALITEQYLTYLEVLQRLDVNEVGDFLELASTLVVAEVGGRTYLDQRTVEQA